MEEEKVFRELQKELERKKAEIQQIELKIREQKKKIAIKNGEVVKRLKDLKCPRHLNAKFVRMHFMPAMSSFTEKPIRYVCQECQKEEKAGKIISFQMTSAYKCPHCGFVIGEYISKHYKSSPESWAALAGREGQHYYCRICGEQIGYIYWRTS